MNYGPTRQKYDEHLSTFHFFLPHPITMFPLLPKFPQLLPAFVQLRQSFIDHFVRCVGAICCCALILLLIVDCAQCPQHIRLQQSRSAL